MKLDLSTQPKVFVSSAYEDKAFSDQVVEQIRSLGAIPVTPVAENLETISSLVAEEVYEAAATVVLVSESSSRSRWQQDEWSLIQQRLWDDPDFKVIPVVMGEVEVPPFLSRIKSVRPSRLGHELREVLLLELETEDNSVPLSDSAKGEILKRYGSMKSHLEASISSLPEEYSKAANKYFEES